MSSLHVDFSSAKAAVIILYTYYFQTHIERAIELNPTDPSNHHLLGRWCYGVSQIYISRMDSFLYLAGNIYTQ